MHGSIPLIIRVLETFIVLKTTPVLSIKFVAHNQFIYY